MAGIENRLRQFLQETSQPAGTTVTLSYAQSLDGSLTARRGEPLALSGPGSLRLTHWLRAAHEAILVGIGTILADDPRLNVRLVEGDDPQPVVLDSQLKFPLNARLLAGEKAPWIACGAGASPARAEALQAAGARLIRLPQEPDGRLSLPALLERMAGESIHSLMIEGGSQVITRFLEGRLAQRAVLTLSPLFVGGLRAVDTLLGKPSAEKAPSFPRLIDPHSEMLGSDLIIWGKIGT